jgi:hypothetical protein
MAKISVGDTLPLDQISFKILKEGEAKDLTGKELFEGKKVALFGVPGAFTPTCTNTVSLSLSLCVRVCVCVCACRRWGEVEGVLVEFEAKSI